MQHDTYILHIWRSRTIQGWQWVARLVNSEDGQRLRFSNPETLLSHLRDTLAAEINHVARDEVIKS